MDQTLPPRLPPYLECAVQRVRMAARSAAEHTVDALGLAALASSSVLQRDALLGAQYELNRKLAIFALTFNESFDTDVARQAGTLVPTPGPAVTPDSLVESWESLTLVDDHEVEVHISADRFALEIAHACEWEIRELDGYMGSLLNLDGADHDRNPLRAEVVGQAMIRAIEAVSDRPEVRKVLGTEISRSLAHAMRQTYSDIVADLRHAGVRPMGMAVRQTPSRPNSLHGALHSSRVALESGYGPATSAGPGTLSRPTGRGPTGATRSGAAVSGFSTGDPSLGRVDPGMMQLLRRLAHRPPDGPGTGAWSAGPDLAGPAWHDSGAAPVAFGAAGQALVATNLIQAYRDELRQVASGSLDHLVIDVVASLFDQILSDAKVPPQMARQIARLQLPVLRAALGDNSFFSSRRHPVRRFVNRIASLGTAVDDFDAPEGRALLARVAALVQEVVDGEFDQIGLYEQKLQALESFIAEQARAEVQALGAADAVLARKEQQLRVQQRYAQELDGALRDLPVPDYLRRFLAETWSQVIATVAADDGEGGPFTTRMRHAGRELVLSVQPKGSPAARQQFLRQLPQLMKDLNTGLDRITCPPETRQQFFAQLLPAHAESLKGQPMSQLETNLLARQVDGALAKPPPRPADLPPLAPGGSASLQAAATPATFTAAEAKAVGLVDEAAVDWSRAVDIDLSAEPELSVKDISMPGLPTAEAAEPTRGKSLADHVQIGFAYLMQLKGEWQKVRLVHVSAGRSFFVFTHGERQRETVSMTHRMLVRLCESGRLRAMENAYLLERATARARRQLAEMPPPGGGQGAPARAGAATGRAESAAPRQLGRFFTRRD